MSIQECKYLTQLAGCASLKPDATCRYHHTDITYPFFLCSAPCKVDLQKHCSGYEEKPDPVLPETLSKK